MIKLIDILAEAAGFTKLPPEAEMPAKKAVTKTSKSLGPVKKKIAPVAKPTKVTPEMQKQAAKSKEKMAKQLKQKKLNQLKIKNPSTGKYVLAKSVYKKGVAHPLYKVAKTTIDKFKAGGKKKGKK